MLAAPLPVVSPAGVLGVVPGASAAAVSRAWHTSLSLVGSPGSICSMTAVRLGRASGYAIFIRGRFAAVFFQAGVRTDRGVAVGAPGSKLRAAYGSSLAGGPATYYVRGRWQLRFDVGGGIVQRIGFGDGLVRLAAGCN